MKQILEYKDVLESLVHKFNKGVWDEDMMQDAWVKAIECYNKCVEQGITDDNIIKAKIITWVKNYFIDEKIRKKTVETTSFNDENEILSQVDTTLLLVELKNSLPEKEKIVLKELLNGKTVDEIAKMLGKTKRQVWRYMRNIKSQIAH